MPNFDGFSETYRNGWINHHHRVQVDCDNVFNDRFYGGCVEVIRFRM